MNNNIKNQLDGRNNREFSSNIFNPKLMLFLVIIGVFSFGAFLTIAGFSQDLKSGNNGGRHAMSKSAIGYNGLMHLLKQNNHEVKLSRAKSLPLNDYKYLRIISMDTGWVSKDFDKMELNSPTLIILPKWSVTNMPKHKGWVQKRNKPFPDTIPVKSIEKLLEKIDIKINIKRSDNENMKVNIRPVDYNFVLTPHTYYNFEKLQIIEGKQILPLLRAEEGILLAKVSERNIYILSDPDFMNTRALSARDRAQFAYNVLMSLQSQHNSRGFIFDLSMHGFSKSRNLLKLALTPPFLSATLLLLAMGALAGWQAVSRFGDSATNKPDTVYGKYSIIENAASFIKMAGREYKMAPDYLALIKKKTCAKLAIPTGMPEAEINKRLLAFEKHTGAGNGNNEENIEELSRLSTQVKETTSLMKLAKKLNKWRGEITNENR